MVCLMSIFGTLSAIYVIPTIYNDYVNLDRAADAAIRDRGQNLVAPLEFDKDNVRLSTIDVNAFAQNAVDVVRLKANALRKNSTVSSNARVLSF